MCHEINVVPLLIIFKDRKIGIHLREVTSILFEMAGKKTYWVQLVENK
jgi:hypothetical protein